jgi:hypothetical protein
VVAQEVAVAEVVAVINQELHHLAQRFLTQLLWVLVAQEIHQFLLMVMVYKVLALNLVH